ncbi:MAG: hypothetical protein KF871_13375 [Hydrogenophaga sp.]|uniref:hypothetical protein n=1 Tax=Hydrogenophaga sp. TaxID=1904254 RepID=UPI001D1DEEF2|nr:hypothetical protein [Hydrogenophaga sp.]MBX3610876.1 hypothetical protein [Hydrogenophaga sp.]
MDTIGWLGGLAFGAGALHGLSPLSGWPLLALCGGAAGHGGRPRWWRSALGGWGAMVLGHALAMAWLALGIGGAAILIGDRAWPVFVVPVLVVLLILVPGTRAVARGAPARARIPWGAMALALWSFGAASVPAVGAALVPALLPWCTSAGGTSSAKGLWLPMAMVALHTAGMALAAVLAARGAALMKPLWRRLFTRRCDHVCLSVHGSMHGAALGFVGRLADRGRRLCRAGG